MVAGYRVTQGLDWNQSKSASNASEHSRMHANSTLMHDTYVLLQACAGNLKAAVCLDTLVFISDFVFAYKYIWLHNYYFPYAVTKTRIIAPSARELQHTQNEGDVAELSESNHHAVHVSQKVNGLPVQQMSHGHAFCNELSCSQHSLR